MTDDQPRWIEVAVFLIGGFLIDCALCVTGFTAYRVWRRRLGRATPPPARA